MEPLSPEVLLAIEPELRWPLWPLNPQPERWRLGGCWGVNAKRVTIEHRRLAIREAFTSRNDAEAVARRVHVAAIETDLWSGDEGTRFPTSKIARLCGIKVDHLKRLHEFDAIPPAEALDRIAVGLNIPHRWLVFGDPHPRWICDLVGMARYEVIEIVRKGESIPNIWKKAWSGMREPQPITDDVAPVLFSVDEATKLYLELMEWDGQGPGSRGLPKAGFERIAEKLIAVMHSATGPAKPVTPKPRKPKAD